MTKKSIIVIIVLSNANHQNIYMPRCLVLVNRDRYVYVNLMAFIMTNGITLSMDFMSIQILCYRGRSYEEHISFPVPEHLLQLVQYTGMNGM